LLLNQEIQLFLLNQRFILDFKLLLQQASLGPNQNGIDSWMLSLQFQEYFQDNQPDEAIKLHNFDRSIAPLILIAIDTVNRPSLARQRNFTLIFIREKVQNLLG